MATISTTGTAIAIDYPSHATITRDVTNGHLFFFARSDTTNNQYRVWRSTDSGGSWQTLGTFSRTGIAEWSSVVVDKAGWLHIAYRQSDGTNDRLYYRRCNIASGSWSSEYQITVNANGGVGGAYWQGVDIAVVRHANGAYAIAVVATNTSGTANYGMTVFGVSITTDRTIYINNGIIIGNRSWQTAGTAPGRSTPVCEIEHNGDGFTSSTPHLWVAWGRNKLFMVKLSWQGTSVGWSGPSTFQTIDSSIPSVDYVAGRWDGSRWLMVVIDTDDTSVVDVYERNQANTATTVRQTPQHPNGVVRTLGISYDASTKNIRVYAVGTTNATLYYVDFIRVTSTWGSWVQVSADAISATPPDEFTVRRGGTTGNARHDVAYTTGTVNPYTLKHVAQVAAYAPNTPVWDTSGQPYTNGGAADVAAALTLDWLFSDTDPGDTQTAYALRRQKGAGAFEYWNATTVTWGGTEVFNTSATTAVTLAAAWGADGDAVHSYAVKTRDTGGLDSPYSASLALTPSAKVNPAITAPTAAQVLATNFVTVTWTAAEQTLFRVWLVTNPGGQVVHDSGWKVGTDTSYTPPVTLADATGWQVWVATTNNERLASTTQTRSFTVDYTEPPAPTLAVADLGATLGLMRVTVTNVAPTGTQPALLFQDVYRREGVPSTLNPNPNFDGNVSQWNGTFGTLTYSTAQKHEGAGSARLVPAGGNVNAYVESLSSNVTVDPTKLYFGGGWIRCDTGNKPITVQINWYSSGNVYQASSVKTFTAPTALTWLYVGIVADPAQQAQVPGRATVSLGLTSTPAAGDAFYVDELVLQQWDDSDGTRIATEVAAGAVVDDWKVAARTPVSYRSVAYGANGTLVASPWTA